MPFRIPAKHPILRLAAIFILLSGWQMASAQPQSDWLGVANRLATLSGASAGPSMSHDPFGSGIDFTPNGSQPGLFYDLQTSESCASCHGGNTGTSNIAFRPFPTWAGSMMANATRDPVFWAALDVANHDVPGVGDYCLRCHTSRGWYGGRVIKPGFGGPNNDVTLGAAGCLLSGAYDHTDNTDNDFSGLACHFCHRLMPNGPNGEPTNIGNGDAWVDDEPCPGGGEPCRRGPFTYTSPQPPHEWAYSDYHTQSAICGLCHNVSTPDTDQGPLKTLKLNDGTDTGHPFPIERTFSEWQQSAFADVIFRNGFDPTTVGSPMVAKTTNCQNCHMPVSEDPDASACIFGGFPDRTGNLPVHAFVGGNTWVPGIIKGEFSDTSAIPGAFGGVGREESYDQTIEWARQMLGNAASLDNTIQSFTPPTASVAGSLDVSVKVTNLSGHKLPTGYAEGRRMWLNLQVRDANGALVFESGAYDSAGAVLSEDAQARVYEVLQGIFDQNGSAACDVVDGNGAAMFHFVLNDCIAKDNRIPPLGFTPATAEDPNGYDLRPVGATYPEASPGVLVNYDTVPYSVSVPPGTVLPLSATARLYYQTSSRDYIEFLRNEAIENGFSGENQMCMAGPDRPFVVGPQSQTRGQYTYDLWNDAAYGKSPPELMQTATATTAP